VTERSWKQPRSPCVRPATGHYLSLVHVQSRMRNPCDQQFEFNSVDDGPRSVNQARRELLDPSRRNRLLHAPLSGKRPWCMAVVDNDPDGIFRSYTHSTVQDQSHRRPSLVLRLEPVQQLLEGFFSCPTGHRHGLKIDRRLLYRVSFSGTVNLPPPRVRRRRPALHGN
jgi:hypothetical protein